MRILVVGDQHFRHELPYASAFLDGRRGEWEAVKSTILKASETANAVVLLGDNLNLRHNHSAVIREFVEFLRAFGDKPIHILVGNHERYGTQTALDFLGKLSVPNWHVYTEVTQDVDILGVKATFIPFCTPSMFGVTTKEEAQKVLFDSLKGGDLAFAHHAITGTKDTEFFNEIMLDQEKMATLFTTTFGGHVHKAERLKKNVVVTGNIFTHEVGEHAKSVYMWDDLRTIEEIPLPVRGIYKLMINKNVYDYPTANRNSIVKAYITSRDVNVEEVKRDLSEKFDSSIVIEQYPNERQKVHFEDGGLDLSIENMLKQYAEAKGLPYADLLEGFQLIK